MAQKQWPRPGQAGGSRPFPPMRRAGWTAHRVPAPQAGPKFLARRAAGRHLDLALRIAPVEREREPVARLVDGQELPELRLRRDRLAVNRNDDVAAERVRLTLDEDRRRTGAQPGTGGRAQWRD